MFANVVLRRFEGLEMDTNSSKTCPELFNVTSQYFQKGCKCVNMPICHVYIEYTRNCSHFFSYL